MHQEANATHSAPADAIAAPRVLDSQVQTYALPADPSPMLVRVDIRGRFSRGAEGVIPFSFGKHRGRPLTTNAVTDEPYLRRMRSGVNLPDDARELTHRAIANRLPVT